MSYDIQLGELDINYTSNVSAVFHDHIMRARKGTLGIITGLQALHDLTGKEAAPYLLNAWEALNQTRHRLYKDGAVGEPVMSAQYDSKNGWGSLIGALIVLGQLTAACALYPKDKIHISA